jgi:exopolysaccharide biosynthesis protein
MSRHKKTFFTSRLVDIIHLLWKKRWFRITQYITSGLLTLSLLFLIWFLYTDSGTHLRYFLADTLITTQHRHWAAYLIGEQDLKKRVDEIWRMSDEFARIQETTAIDINTALKKPLVEIEQISGTGFKGYILSIADPKKIRIVVPSKVGIGERVSEMVSRTGAVAGVNAGGFADPQYRGNGFVPIGIVMSGGELFFNGNGGDVPTHIVGIDKNGKMVAGKYRPSELLQMGVSEAVTFSPKFIVNGQGMIKSRSAGWGVAPRTCMAQTADGTILFAIIDGRQTHSIGATLYDIQQIFLDKGAVIAANLDGGSSTILVHNKKIVNSPAGEYGERHLSSAFLVFEDPNEVKIKNIWQGIDHRNLDAGKW